MSAKLLVTKVAAPQRCIQETTPVLLELASGISATRLRSAHSLTRFGPLKLGDLMVQPQATPRQFV